jgi:tRNA nucleotidyltransferase/poly(A) polymerase
MTTLLDQFCNYALTSGIAKSSYLVGGSVRDMLMGNEIRDADIVIKGDAFATGRAFSAAIGATFIMLDEKFGIARIALNSEHIDICPQYGAAIIEDLGNRDLTINAMAMPISELIIQDSKLKIQDWTHLVIDPHGGLRDIDDKLVRMISEKNLVSDPLRLLRIYRFASTLGFKIDDATSVSIHKHAPLITNAAVERIAAELRYILSCKSSLHSLMAMKESGLLSALFPVFAGRTDDTWSNIWSSYESLEEILCSPDSYFPENNSSLIEYFASAYRVECLKLSILVNDSMLAEQIARSLKFSNKETEYIGTIAIYNQIISSIDSAKRSIITGLLRELGENIYAVLVYIVAAATHPSEQQNRIRLAREIIAIYQDEYIPRLSRLPFIDGNDLIKEFRLSPSPFFSDILSAVELMALEGHVASRDEALRAAGAMIRKQTSAD